MIAPKELENIARIRMSQLSDAVPQAAHQISCGDWDRAAQTCVRMNLAVNQLAGAISQLLPAERQKVPKE